MINLLIFPHQCEIKTTRTLTPELIVLLDDKRINLFSLLEVGITAHCDLGEISVIDGFIFEKSEGRWHIVVQGKMGENVVFQLNENQGKYSFERRLHYKTGTFGFMPMQVLENHQKLTTITTDSEQNEFVVFQPFEGKPLHRFGFPSPSMSIGISVFDVEPMGENKIMLFCAQQPCIVWQYQAVYGESEMVFQKKIVLHSETDIKIILSLVRMPQISTLACILRGQSHISFIDNEEKVSKIEISKGLTKLINTPKNILAVSKSKIYQLNKENWVISLKTELKLSQNITYISINKSKNTIVGSTDNHQFFYLQI